MPKIVDTLATWLLIFGALAWGYFALTSATLLALLGLSAFASIFYGAVGLAGVYELLKEVKVVK